ncbi:MAG: prepilin-type N-terminal cleavage/methylation domain-containing protein [Planctomycetes bacterium]|nr:prepilin-type N-terminal cleavage/methylation domain-containing protein [Planctomycetota bacterium]
MKLWAKRTARRAAFTLVEVLVALLIVGGIMLALTQLLEATRISRDTIHNIQETQLAGPAIMDLVERDVRAMLIYNRASDRLLRVKNRVVLGRDADRIDFITTTDSVVPSEVEHRFVRSDVNEVGYVLRIHPRDDEFLEMYRREDFGVDDEPFEGGTYTFLHDHVKSFEIQVYDEDGPDAEPLDDWGEDEEQVGLPKRLEIRLTLELTPRLSHEQLRIAPVDKRTVTYTRIIRFTDDLFAQVEVQPVPTIPVFGAAPQDNAGGGGAGGEAGGPTTETVGGGGGGTKAGGAGQGGAKGGASSQGAGRK